MKTTRNLNWLYPVGFFGFGFAETLFTQWIVYYHNPPTGPKGLGAWIGTVLLISFLLQGLLNPILGYLTDRIRHRWGRRRPVILFSSLPMAMCFWGIWQTQHPLLSLFLICGFGLFFVAVVQPFVTLLPSIAKDISTRVKFTLAGGICSLLASGLGLMGGAWILEQSSFKTLGFIGALGIGLTLFLPMLFLKEDVPSTLEPREKQSFQDFLNEMKEVLSNADFAWFLLSNAAVAFVLISLTISLPFLCTQLLQQPRSFVSTLNGFVFCGVILAGGYTQWKSKSLSFVKALKYLSLLNALTLSALTGFSLFFKLPLYLWYLGLVCMGALVMVALMSPHMVISEMTLLDGKHREGAFFGANGLVLNFSNAMASQLSALLLVAPALQGFQIHSVLGVSVLFLVIAAWGLKQVKSDI